MKLSTINTIIKWAKILWCAAVIFLSILIIFFQINYLTHGGIRRVVEVEHTVYHRVDEIEKKEVLVKVQKSMPEIVDLQGVITLIANHEVGAQLIITNDCPEFTHSVVCYITNDAPPTSSLSEAKKNI